MSMFGFWFQHLPKLAGQYVKWTPCSSVDIFIINPVILCESVDDLGFTPAKLAGKRVATLSADLPDWRIV